MLLLLLSTPLVCLLWPQVVQCQEEATGGRFIVDGDIRHFVATLDGVYIATDERLYQLSRGLRLVYAVNQTGILTGKSDTALFSRVTGDSWNDTLSVTVLVPFVENGTLISCGVTDNVCSYCELLALANISTVLHREHIPVGPYRRISASVAFLVAVQRATRDFYIMTAIQQRKDETPPSMCASFTEAVYIHDTDNKHDGGIFSFSGDGSHPLFKSSGDVDFMDGFQINSVIYLFANVLSSQPGGNRVRLIWLQAKTKKADTMKSLRGASLVIPGKKGSRLVASSAVSPGPPSTLWVGVFNVDLDPSSTQLALFDISPDLKITTDEDPDFCSTVKCSRQNFAVKVPKVLQPLKVLFRQTSMTSVLATTQGPWMVFFVGTADGQLIKLSVDSNYHSTCPTLLYRTADDRKVFPSMHLDKVDGKHLYAAFSNQVQRVSASVCHAHKTLEGCWSAQDPSCVWCHAKKSCTFKDECRNSHWLSYPDDYQNRRISYTVKKESSGQIRLDVRTHVSADPDAATTFACQFSGSSGELCRWDGPGPIFPQCTCILINGTLSTQAMSVTVKFRLGSMSFRERIQLMTCPDVRGSPPAALCQRCFELGCRWSNGSCAWATAGVMDRQVCQTIQSRMNVSKPEISSVTPNVVSFYGHNNAVLSGYNLSHVTRVRILTSMDCVPQETPVWNNTGVSLMFHIPAIQGKGTVRVCAVLPDGSCHGNSAVTYTSSPSCAAVTPRITWSSGKRKITLVGTNLEVVDGVLHSHARQEVSLPIDRNSRNLTYRTPAAESTPRRFTSSLSLKVANETLACTLSIIYYPDPHFTSFTPTRTGEDVRVTIQKTSDNLEMSIKDVSAAGVYEGKDYPCVMEAKDTNNQTDFFICQIRSVPDMNFRQLKVLYGDKTVMLQNTSHLFSLMLIVLLLIPCIIVVVMMVYRRQQKQLTVKMNKLMENLELDIRNDIRQGFVDMQTEKADLMENVCAIPFLDYKHFASRIFFPENEALMALCMADVGEVAVKVRLDECCQALSKLLHDRRFLTSMVHAVEEQKSFTIKDKCALASLLTVALHGDLSYLTEVMEVLLKDLMRKNGGAQPKMLLRRTESVVEKLLTNWMSICLYGFLRESVGQHLFLLVSALAQQIARGPVDCVTEKALYTLSEDWLLWQAQDFTSLRLKVLFAVGSGGEVSEPLEVLALNCDTVEQVKEKILNTFKAKFGFPYNGPQTSVCIEFDRSGVFVALEEVDASSEVIGEVTMLNTLEHYKVPDGATIKVLSRKNPSVSPQSSLKDDQDFSGKYFHLIDPDVDEDRGKGPERKKLKLKEVHLTKLLSTKVAVHSFVENLFRSIWGLPNCRAPLAVKYFFDFLDCQADNMKIPDPDVLHIWKTNRCGTIFFFHHDKVIIVVKNSRTGFNKRDAHWCQPQQKCVNVRKYCSINLYCA
ncbi:plexin-C1 isoform X1 [Hippocampus comes]|uniref:plexin-C1 isoform X1 n=1 Tax=Hippocampus comes TaxID=109280 RepID=UPI00094EC1B9|nr:PREDICTED: plexin-C1-like isoform X1 [Hippocampus comes]XP_019751927.1 PREDICTED: plexin-C1-like isoform X1 [Hippocampus comes]